MKPDEEIRITVEDMLNYEKFVKKMDIIDARLQELVFSTVQDPLVRVTKWSPNHSNAANFRTHALVLESPQRLEFRVTREMQVFSLILVALGIAAAALNLWQGVPPGGKLAGVLAVSGLFIATGCYILVKSAVPFVFDIGRGVFWRGRENPELYSRSSSNRISDIQALQLIAVCNLKTMKNVKYYSYELNLVLRDGKRVTVVSHGDRQKLVSDAQTVAAALKKPLWDAIDLVIDFYKGLKSRS